MFVHLLVCFGRVCLCVSVREPVGLFVCLFVSACLLTHLFLCYPLLLVVCCLVVHCLSGGVFGCSTWLPAYLIVCLAASLPVSASFHFLSAEFLVYLLHPHAHSHVGLGILNQGPHYADWRTDPYYSQVTSPPPTLSRHKHWRMYSIARLHKKHLPPPVWDVLSLTMFQSRTLA